MTEGKKKRGKAEGGGSLLEKAVRLLGHRDYAEAELRARLVASGGSEEDAESVMGRLKELGYLNEARFAERTAEEGREVRLHGKRRVAAELRAKQVEEQHLQTAVEAAFADADEDEIARQHLRVRLAAFLTGDRLEDPKELRKAYGRLRRAGFGHGVAVRALRAHSRLAGNLDDSDTLEEE